MEKLQFWVRERGKKKPRIREGKLSKSERALQGNIIFILNLG